MSSKSVSELNAYINTIISNTCSVESLRIVIARKLDQYREFISYWYRVHNIVSRNNTDCDILENIGDSLTVLTFKDALSRGIFESNSVITDAGAGGGFPGIPLAIALPNINFNLVDINRKKCSFLRAAKAKIGLINIAIFNKNITETKPSRFILTKAAFSPAHVGILAEALVPGGNLVIWATPNNKEKFELALSRYNISLSSHYHYCLPSGKIRSLLLFTKP